MSNTVTQVLQLFPTPMQISQLDVNVDDIEKCLTEQFPDLHPQVTGSYVSAHTQILEHSLLKNLKEQILNNVRHYLDNIASVIYEEVYISSSWYNVNPYGTSARQHTHPNSYLSGVFYVKTPDASNISLTQGYTRFHSPLTPLQSIFNLEIKDTNDYNAMACIIEPKVNQLVLFPSYVPHEVDTYYGSFPRISIAFNVFFKGRIGNENSKTFLRV